MHQVLGAPTPLPQGFPPPCGPVDLWSRGFREGLGTSQCSGVLECSKLNVIRAPCQLEFTHCGTSIGSSGALETWNSQCSGVLQPLGKA